MIPPSPPPSLEVFKNSSIFPVRVVLLGSFTVPFWMIFRKTSIRPLRGGGGSLKLKMQISLVHIRPSLLHWEDKVHWDPRKTHVNYILIYEKPQSPNGCSPCPNECSANGVSPGPNYCNPNDPSVWMTVVQVQMGVDLVWFPDWQVWRGTRLGWWTTL